jgi:hypothetical protein
MLEIRPNCEHCDKDLPPSAEDARICTYECTFCSHCVDTILANVCPNCGGGFAVRPIRPQYEHRAGLSLTHQPASSLRVHSKFSVEQISSFSTGLKSIEPDRR